MRTGDEVHSELSGGTYTWCLVYVPQAARELLNFGIPVGGYTLVHTTPAEMLTAYEHQVMEKHMMLCHDAVEHARTPAAGLRIVRRWARVYRIGTDSAPGETLAPWIAPHFNDGSPVAPLFRTLLLDAYWKLIASGVLTYHTPEDNDE
jgi:hypothetical protein